MDFSQNPFSLPGSAPGVGARAEEGDPIGKWLHEKRRKQAAEKKNPRKATPTPTIKKNSNKKKLKEWLQKEDNTADKLRKLNQKTGCSVELMDEIFTHDFLYPEKLKGRRKKRVYAGDLAEDDSIKLALAILKKYPEKKSIYGIK